ncbi:hypothetical protein [Vibrio breoganii]|uniref:hypothetical protein n=1 Tax=Vibrio breoganii TaxID=553239 RepID=UPI00037766C7|nr:hypothetical protein [Vibrio breoganii]OED95182.1 hypothetical protein A1QE_15855 [Vibrio breoganii ZF-55]PMM87096.1 hypothetical protein BCT45_05185 [Vibrio breoganii]PMP02162.1 hypothetical protein BCS95_11815 [Vibrio breoganii]
MVKDRTKKSNSNQRLPVSKDEHVPAFKDENYHLLSAYPFEIKSKIIKLRAKYGLSIPDAISRYEENEAKKVDWQERMKRKKRLARQGKRRSKPSKQKGASQWVMTSLVGVTSARSWKKTK